MKNPHDKTEIQEVSPAEAMEILNKEKNSVLVDVRSKVEFDYVGHPPGAISVPWQEPPLWKVIPDFAANVRDRLSELDLPGTPESLTILTLCRSGSRSYDAAAKLSRNGFARVINIAEGFEGSLDNNRQRGNISGWRFRKLPWVQT